MAEINGISVPFIPIEPTGKTPVQAPANSFNSVFQNELDKIKISGHARKRLDARNIELDDPALLKLQDAVKKAGQKGAKDSLIMFDNTAYIVNIPNKTIVTAIGLEETNENIFTNIDSVVII